MQAVKETLDRISVVNLSIICRRYARLRKRDTDSRPKIYTAFEQQPAEIQTRIYEDAATVVKQGLTKHRTRKARDGSGRASKRTKHHHNPAEADTAEHISHEQEPIASTERPGHVSQQRISTTVGSPNAHPVEETDSSVHAEEEDVDVRRVINSDFMRAPTKETLDGISCRFIDATSNAALKCRACASCAREMESISMTEHLLRDVANIGQLEPANFRRRTYDYAMRRMPFITQKEQTAKTQLSQQYVDRDIPNELNNLTLPERMLIAMYYPAAYIVKLFPKHQGSHGWDRSQMHNGLKGNVATYRLDPSLVASMIDGSIFPPPVTILSATIGITFVGPKSIPEKSMPSMFRVRRRRVHAALLWLKDNNPLYQNIEISQERLGQLPENAVPEEIIMTAKHSTDIEAVELEHAGYVPMDGAEEIEAEQHRLKESGLVDIEDEDHEQETEPAIIPVQATGVVDIDGGDITSRELMAHALSNGALKNLPDDFTIKRGSTFVNEYARTDPITQQRNDGGPSNANHLLGSFPTLFPYGKEDSRLIDRRTSHTKYTPDGHYNMPTNGFAKTYIFRSKYSVNLLSTLKPEDLLKASQEEMRNVRFSNPAVQALRNQLSAVRTKVKGTDESRQHVRSKVWSSNLVFNAPCLWATINPTDTQDPIAQVMTGADIDLDAFCNTAGPDHIQRAVNVANDP
ncbi:hypothetical protein BDZ97DRAFT_1768290 [Flammula alnicola]|nr:hypothetical protein BDZ97DRAFT_1768290 [Flammula alnicola]